MPSELPVDRVLPELTKSLSAGGCVVLRAPPGAGKTTRVPPALLNAGYAGPGLIVMLEPRRIAARTAAHRIAQELGEKVGQTSGYCVRFEQNQGPYTRILTVTEGIMLRRLQDDPFLEDCGVVIFDEFHERRLESDLALAMTRRVQQTVRPDLKIVVMSATLDADRISAFLGDCPVICSEGRQFPVAVEYLKSGDVHRFSDRGAMAAATINGIRNALQKSSGDVLVFLPGVAEILRVQRELATADHRTAQFSVMSLYGEMSAEEQDRVFAPCDRRRVILATNVAETSVTIDGVTAVVDTGLARQMLFTPEIGLDRLELVPISRAAADQRAGRAGRTAPGICIRLWGEAVHRTRPEFETSEVQRIDLSSALLRLVAWGESQADAFPWFEKPSKAALQGARRLLTLLGAIDDKGITSLGRSMVKFPVSPRIARLLIEGARTGQPERCLLLAAMLSERDPFRSSDQSGTLTEHGQRKKPGQPHTTESIRSRSDVLDRLNALEEHLRTGHLDFRAGTIQRHIAQSVHRVAEQLRRLLKNEIDDIGDALQNSSISPDRSVSNRSRDGSPFTYDQSADTADADTALLKALLAAFPDRVARRREPGSDRALMVGGRGVRQAAASTVVECPLYLCIQVDDRGTDAVVRQASEVSREWLPSQFIRSENEVFFHPSRKQVVARRRIYFDDLLLEESPAAIDDDEKAAAILYESAKGQMAGLLPKTGDAMSSFLNRVRFLRQSMPEADLPEFSEIALQEVLRELCVGRQSFDELQRAPWLTMLRNRISYEQRQLIDREAPERLALPGGKQIGLTYEDGQRPVLAVRIQDLFGWRQAPRIAGGRVSVLLHLLAPNMRPQQITDDLNSFWVNTYPEVRKELKRRYPKHSWPDDPFTGPSK